MQLHHQARLLPQREDLLAFHPVLGYVCEFEIEVEEDFSENEAHFGVGEAVEHVMSAGACLCSIANGHTESRDNEQ